MWPRQGGNLGHGTGGEGGTPNPVTQIVRNTETESSSNAKFAQNGPGGHFPPVPSCCNTALMRLFTSILAPECLNNRKGYLMDFQLAEEQQMIQAAGREFAREEIAPVARHFVASVEFPTEHVRR